MNNFEIHHYIIHDNMFLYDYLTFIPLISSTYFLTPGSCEATLGLFFIL